MLDKFGIRLAFRNLLPTIEGLPKINSRWAFENESFAPPAPKEDDPTGSLWCRETYMSGQQVARAFGYVEENSIIQYDVYAPAGGGTKEAEILAKAIGDTFKPGTGLSSTGIAGVTAATPSAASGNPIQISIYRSEPGAAVMVSAYGGVWWQIPIRIYFRAYGTY